ncbi:MAG: hypothetical protein AAGF11_54405 [Myxococcota bacterium]
MSNLSNSSNLAAPAAPAAPAALHSINPRPTNTPPQPGKWTLVLPAVPPYGPVVLGEDETFWHIELTGDTAQFRPLRDHGLAFVCIGHTQAIEPAGPAARVAYLQSRRVVTVDLTTGRGHTTPVTENPEHMSVRGAWLDTGNRTLIVEVRDTSDFYRGGVIRHALCEIRVPAPTTRPVQPTPSSTDHDSHASSPVPGRTGSPPGEGLATTPPLEPATTPHPEPATTPHAEPATAPHAEPATTPPELIATPAPDEPGDDSEWDALLEDLDDLLQETEDEVADLEHDRLDPELTAALMELQQECDAHGAPRSSAQLVLGTAPRDEFTWHAGGGVIIVVRGTEVTAWESPERPVQHPLAHALAGFTREGATITAVRLHPRRECAVFCVRRPKTEALVPREELWCANWHNNAYAARWPLQDGLEGSIELGQFDLESDWIYYDLHTRDMTQRYVQRARRGSSEPYRLDTATGPMAWSPPGPRCLMGFDLESGTITRWAIDTTSHRGP